MPRTAIAALGTYTPDRVVTNEELTRYMETSDEWIAQRTGIKERRWVKPNEQGNTDLALEATRRALDAAGWQATDIEAIVYATLSMDHMFPGDGCFLNARLGLPGVPALDVRTQCTGFIYGLSVADSWIKTGMFKKILLVGSEVHSTGLDLSTRGRDVACIFGDAAGVALLEATDDPERGVLSTHLHADGRFAKDLWVDRGGSRHHPRFPEGIGDTPEVFPHMEGQKVFKHAVVKMPEVMREALDRNGYTPKDLKLLVPHQANLRIAEMVQRSLELRDDQVFNNIEKYGNTTAASIPLCLAEAVQVRGVRKGDLVGLCAFGSGFTWASALLRW